MWIERLTYSRTTRAAELAAQFAAERHRVLAENLANVDTPDYHAKQLDPTAFQKSLKEALDASQPAGSRTLELRHNAQFAVDARGQTTVRPDRATAPNVLFHDGTNAQLEQTVADVNSNALTYELATDVLRGRFDNLLRAIRGRIT